MSEDGEKLDDVGGGDAEQVQPQAGPSTPIQHSYELLTGQVDVHRLLAETQEELQAARQECASLHKEHARLQGTEEGYRQRLGALFGEPDLQNADLNYIIFRLESLVSDLNDRISILGRDKSEIRGKVSEARALVGAEKQKGVADRSHLGRLKVLVRDGVMSFIRKRIKECQRLMEDLSEKGLEGGRFFKRGAKKREAEYRMLEEELRKLTTLQLDLCPEEDRDDQV